jgi:predicted nucleic acid-binding protein
VVPWDVFFSTLLYWDISLSAAKRAGAWRYQFARRGTPLSVSDTLVGAVALEQGATIVTNNVKDYPMGGLHLLSFGPEPIHSCSRE